MTPFLKFVYFYYASRFNETGLLDSEKLAVTDEQTHRQTDGQTDNRVILYGFRLFIQTTN